MLKFNKPLFRIADNSEITNCYVKAMSYMAVDLDHSVKMQYIFMADPLKYTKENLPFIKESIKGIHDNKNERGYFTIENYFPFNEDGTVNISQAWLLWHAHEAYRLHLVELLGLLDTDIENLIPTIQGQ